MKYNLFSEFIWMRNYNARSVTSKLQAEENFQKDEKTYRNFPHIIQMNEWFRIWRRIMSRSSYAL